MLLDILAFCRFGWVSFTGNPCSWWVLLLESNATGHPCFLPFWVGKLYWKSLFLVGTSTGK